MQEPMPIGLDWFTDSDYGVGPPVNDEMIKSAEAALGYKLPAAYINLIRARNGGTPRQNCFPTQVPTGWAEDHVEIDVIFGIGCEDGIDSQDGSSYLIREWGYPAVGVVIGMTPSAGHEAIMLDYSLCGPLGEPNVMYVDTETADGKPYTLVLASSFATFLQGLVSRDDFQEAGDA